MYTTKLLDIIDDRMPRRHQLITAAIVVFLALGSIASSVTSRPAPAAVQDRRPIILIATPSPLPTGAAGLAKRAAPLGAAPTVAPTPTREAQITSAPDEQTGERPSDKPAPPRSHERTTDKAAPNYK